MNRDMVKNILKRLIYNSGLLSVFHILKNKKALTVVVFHRVIKKSDYRWPQTDKEWSVSDTFFKECLVFFKNHYTPVSLNDITDASLGKKALPEYPLLITFDDGWKDNYDYAFPLILEQKVPITIFCTTDAINNKYLNWRDVIYALSNLDKNLLKYVFETLSKYNISLCKDSSESEIISAVQLSDHKEKIITEINNLLYFLGEPNQMLSASEIIEMNQSGLVSFGAHGHTHEPLLDIKDPAFELEESKQILADILNADIESMAYPHSSVNKSIYKLAIKQGYKFQFAGRNHLNIILKNNNSYFFGRTAINQMDVTRKNGEFSPELLALSLFRLKHRVANF